MKTIEQELQDDFTSIQEALLSEAKSILKKEYSKEEIEVLSSTKKLGFGNSVEVKAFEDWEKAKRVDYYSSTYPLYKFITEGAVKAVCKKYGLLLAVAGDYKGDIPFENQKAIVNFRVHEDDLPGLGTTGVWLHAVLRNYPGNYDYTDPEENPKEKDASPMKRAKNLKIIAPPSKLKMKGKKVKGHCLIQKDPIVLQPVNDGYLIVTAWGFEANDDSIKNPKMN